MSEAYIQELEEEVERLRNALKFAQGVLNENWSDSRTIGLIPHKHFHTFIDVNDSTPIKEAKGHESSTRWETRVYSSLRSLRNFILSFESQSEREIWVRTFDAGEGKRKIYRESVDQDSDCNPNPKYFLEFRIHTKMSGHYE